MRLSGYGAAVVGREVILDRRPQVSQEETSEQRPAWNEGRSPQPVRAVHRRQRGSVQRPRGRRGPSARQSRARGAGGLGREAGDTARRGW